ncbi:MAG: hypothetical protein HY077_17045 [Elusimicrobia bacterium]|nr:hypothetical protein [Elusimicrobiota bacterium]
MRTGLCLAVLSLPCAAAARPAAKASVDPFCVSAREREALKTKYKDRTRRSDCGPALRKLKLARVDCADPQSIRDFKSAMLAAVRPDDAYAEGFARALCPGKADAACMNPEPQCRLEPFRSEPEATAGAPREKFAARLRKHYLDRLKDISDEQARVLVDHYLELRGTH